MPGALAVALAQPAEQRIVDPQVMGSTPIGHPKPLPSAAAVGYAFGQPSRHLARGPSEFFRL